MRSIGKKAADKLREKSGASLAAALLFFVVCAVVGSVVLSAAMSSLGSSASRDLGDQQRYDVSSAAELLAANLSGNFTEDDTSVPYDASAKAFTFLSKSYSYYTNGDSSYYTEIDADGVPTGEGLSENDFLKTNVLWNATGLLSYHGNSEITEEDLSSLRSAMALRILSAYWLGTGREPSEEAPAGSLVPKDRNYRFGQSSSWDTLAKYDAPVLSAPCVITLTPNYTGNQDADSSHSVTAEISMDDDFHMEAKCYLTSDGSYEKTAQPYLVEIDPGEISYVFRKVTESTEYAIRYTYVPDQTDPEDPGTGTVQHSDWIETDADFTPQKTFTAPEGYHIDPSGTQLRTHVTEHLTFTLSFPGWQEESKARITTLRPAEETSGS